MKVVAFNGSPRVKGNTRILIGHVLTEIEKAGVETEVVQVGAKDLHGCRACYECKERLDRRCAFDDDIANECIDKMIAADGVLLASPTYFSDVTPEIKALMDRAGLVTRANGDLLRRKAGAAVVAVRRAGAMHAFDTLNHFFTISQMIIPGSSYWNVGIGRAPGEVEGDEEGVATMRTLGQNMAWLLAKLRG
ncbi:MAG: flavodoxin family protein [Deltaproteobacteria bacterium]|nr:flavodoxin family protein [Deltaproteobacteria bacterium]